AVAARPQRIEPQGSDDVGGPLATDGDRLDAELLGPGQELGAELRSGDEEPRLGVVDGKDDLVGRGPGVEGDDDAAGLPHPEQRLEEFRTVGRRSATRSWGR